MPVKPRSTFRPPAALPATPAEGAPTPDADLAYRRQHGAVLPYVAADDPPHDSRDEAGHDPDALAWRDPHPLKLDLYLDRGRITDAQHAAGECFRDLWLAAGREPASTLDYTPLRGRAYEVSDASAVADRRCRDAERVVPGPCRLAVAALCCWDRHAPIALVREGLDALVRHFGLRAGGFRPGR